MQLRIVYSCTKRIFMSLSTIVIPVQRLAETALEAASFGDRMLNSALRTASSTALTLLASEHS
jgi:hypothetical protein